MTSNKDFLIADKLSKEGIKFSSEIKDINKLYFDDLSSSYFSIAVAISLTWTKHANLEDEFIEYAAEYIDSSTKYDSNITKRFASRFGVEQLDNVLLNYRKFNEIIKDTIPDFKSCDILEIIKLQQNMLNKLHDLRAKGSISLIGPWLFTGPFKIILSDQERFWNEPGLNAIVLPTGFEVDKGLKMLLKQNYDFMQSFDSNWLKSDHSLLDNYGTYHLIHKFMENIGKITNTPALHINSGIYLLGKNEI